MRQTGGLWDAAELHAPKMTKPLQTSLTKDRGKIVHTGTLKHLNVSHFFISVDVQGSLLAPHVETAVVC